MLRCPKYTEYIDRSKPESEQLYSLAACLFDIELQTLLSVRYQNALDNCALVPSCYTLHFRGNRSER